MEALFWLLFVIPAWCYLGYPAVIVLRARFRPRPTALRDAAPREVSVVLAVRNEAARVAERIRDLLAQDGVAEVIVVCNGCDDGTDAVAERMAAVDPRVRVLRTDAAQGKSGSVSAGVAAARSPLVVFADARQSFAPGAVRALAAPFRDPEVGAATGRLQVGAGEGAVEGVRAYWGMETALRVGEARTGSVVGVTGAIYAVRRALFAPLPANVILDDVLVPMRVAMRGYRVGMAADAVAFDLPAHDAGSEYRRKRRTMVGNLQLVRLCPALLSPRANPLWVRFLSHKLLRLATPACFLGMMAVAALLPGPFYRAAFVALAALYAAGLAGLCVKSRLLAVPAAFVLVHAAVFSAFWHSRGGAADVWTPRPVAGR